MPSENPYLAYVESFKEIFERGESLPLGKIPKPPAVELEQNAPLAIIFSPHPDDECIIGGLPLRLMRESGVRVLNVAVTLGSNHERRSPRLNELQQACDWLGFELMEAKSGGLDNITLQRRREDQSGWEEVVNRIAGIISSQNPDYLFLPHDKDWNGTHLGVHYLTMDALRLQSKEFETNILETEFWGQMQSPNLMVESSTTDLADILAALSYHVGEIQRNPYHLRLPAWMQDNVRVGAELVGGQGGVAPDFNFATLYRSSIWKNGKKIIIGNTGRQLSKEQDPHELFEK